MMSIKQIQKDFDRIAVLSEHAGESGGIYDPFLLKFVPAQCACALEVGCGIGTFTRRLAKRANRVIAIDLSSEMVRIARKRSADYLNIDFSVSDVLETDLPAGQFDCIVMIATLHHLPSERVLEKLKHSLRSDGVLILYDLLTPQGALPRLADLVRFPLNVGWRWHLTGQPLAPRGVRRAWAEHGKNERYLTKREVEAMRDCCLPGAQVKYHLLWRYTIVWYKQAAA
jgi:SAM-dependent methyltransferase